MQNQSNDQSGKSQPAGDISKDRDLIRASDGRNWFKCRRDYLEIMSRLEAWFIQDLIDRAGCALRKNKMTRDNFFQCTIRYLEKGSRWTRAQQNTYFSKFKQLGWIEIKRMRKRKYALKTRWVRIRVSKIEDHLVNKLGQIVDEYDGK